MKKLMLACAATVAFVSVASAADPVAWFGGLGSSASGGGWTDPMPTGVSYADSKYTLDEVDSFAFTAAVKKVQSETTNLNFSTTAKFMYSYDALPAIDPEAKAGIVVYTNEYYVLAKDGTTNNWARTCITADVKSDVAVGVTVSNGVYAIYTIGSKPAIVKEIVSSGDWGTVDYKGSGEISALTATTTELGGGSYPIPGGDPIPAARAEAWAAAQGIAKADINAVLQDTNKYNGRTPAESCILGVKTNDVLTAANIDENALYLKFTVNCDPIAGRVRFKMKKNAEYGAPQLSQTFEFATLESDGVYQIFAAVDSSEDYFTASQQIGVKGTSVAANKYAYIGAPWSDCPVTNLLKKTCCSENDMLEVFDTAHATNYYTWVFTSGKWGYAAVGSEPEPSFTLLKGQAVRYKAAATATLYAIGDVSSVGTTAVVAGEDKWNLVAHPQGTFSASKLPLDTGIAQAIVLLDDGMTVTNIYRKSSGKVWVKDGYGDKTWSEATGTVSGGFFLKSEKAATITWPVE